VFTRQAFAGGEPGELVVLELQQSAAQCANPQHIIVIEIQRPKTFASGKRAATAGAKRVSRHRGLEDPGSATGDEVGSRQADQFLSHNHGYEASTYLGSGLGNWSGGYWDNRPAATNSAGGSETRAKNVYVYYMIRAI